jgi:hypothetical protein
MKTTEKTLKIRPIDAVAIIAAIGVVIFVSYGIYLAYKSYPHQPTLTTQISMNSDGGILTINMTFSNNIDYGLLNTYSSYKINSATEELPNGTIISPATSYVLKQIQVDCVKYIYLGNSNYYSC